MAAKKKYLPIILVAVFASIAMYFFSEYNRQPAAVADIKTDVNISAGQLISAFEKNELTANKKFLGKVIAVNGGLVDIQNQGDTTMTVILGKQANIHNISCLLDAGEVNDARQLKVGDEVAVKGICTGYLMDVELNRCIIIK